MTLISREPSREEAARAAQRQDEDDRLNAANRIYRGMIDDAAQFTLLASAAREDHRYRYLVEAAVERMRWHLEIATAQPIVSPYARALREQAETITPREQIIEKLEE